jgi:hypothetical protein
VYPISGQQSTELLTLQVSDNSLDLKSDTSPHFTWFTHLLNDCTKYSVEGEHDIPFGAKHDPQQIFEPIGIDIAIKQLLRRHEEVIVVLLGWVVAMLDTKVLDVGLG